MPLQMQMYMAVRIVLQTRMIRNSMFGMSPLNPPNGPSPPAPAAPVVESADLFNGAAEIVIRHAGREYRLRRTRLDKLILTA